MRRKLAYAAARWLSKRENRDKLMDSARKLKQRIEHEEGMHDTRPDSANDRADGRPRPRDRS